MYNFRNGESRLDSILLPQLHQGPIECRKLCLSLCSFKWVRATLRRVRSLIPIGLCNLKVLFCLVLIKFSICFLEDSKIAESRIFILNLSNSLITDGNKELLKKLYLLIITFKLFKFLVTRNLLVGIALNK